MVERMWGMYGAVGACLGALEKTREYIRERRAFGAPLLAAEVDLLRTYNTACAEAYARGEDTRRQATIAKFKAGRLSREVADWCLQFHGGIGYMEEMWTARFFRDNRLTGIGGGADEVMLRVLAQTDGYTSNCASSGPGATDRTARSGIVPGTRRAVSPVPGTLSV